MSTEIECSNTAKNETGPFAPVPGELDGIVTVVFLQQDLRCTTAIFRMICPTEEQWGVVSRGVNGTPLEKMCVVLLLMYYKHTKDRTDGAKELRRYVKKLRTLEKVELLFDSNDPATWNGFVETRPVKHAMIII